MTDFDAFFEIFIYVLNTQQRKQCKKRKLGQNLKLLFLKYQETTEKLRIVLQSSML